MPLFAISLNINIMMQFLYDFLNINTIFFTFLGYPMSYLEFFGTIFNIWCVYLAAKNRIATWPVGIIGIFCYVFLFYQIQLYSDLVEQIYFFLASLYGWYVWTMIARKKEEGGKDRDVLRATSKEKTVYAAIVVLGTLGMGYLMSNIHIYFPELFPLPASFAYLDAFTTVMSFLAQFIMAQKKIECWYLWILVDIIGICLYYIKGVKFIALEYVIFLALATKGLFDWRAQFFAINDKTAKKEV
jgi:nicotinamide mononucleotide transporter